MLVYVYAYDISITGEHLYTIMIVTLYYFSSSRTSAFSWLGRHQLPTHCSTTQSIVSSSRHNVYENNQYRAEMILLIITK